MRYIDADKIGYHFLHVVGHPVPEMFATEFEINAIPTADVQEVKHGYWIDTTAYCGEFTCSICEEMCVTNKYKYCPHCGAKMCGGIK